MHFLLELHPIFSFALMSTACVLLALGGLTLVRKHFQVDRLKENHEVAGIIFNAFGIIYAVLIAFVVFAAWTSYDGTSKNVEIEVNKLAALFMDSAAFDNPVRQNIRVAVTEYTKAVIDDEWPLLATGGKSPESVREKHNAIWNAYVNVDVKTIRNPYMYDESLRQLNTMAEYRRLRLFASRSSTPIVIWIVLIVGGVISVCYILFFGTRHKMAQNVMVAAYTIMNSIVLFLVYVLDHPFVGYNAISNEPFKSVLRMFINRLGR